MRPGLVWSLWAVLALLCGGCGSFSASSGAGARGAAVQDSFCGQWEGRWVSAKHANSSGKLLCRLTKMEEGLYRAEFRAYWLAFHANYAVRLSGRERGGVLVVEGSHELPKLYGGTYQYSGRVTLMEFKARYGSSYDEGVFELSRPR